MTALVGARIFDGERFLDDHVVIVEGTRIADVAPYAERPRGGGEIDLGGGLLAPGFIDVQVNGGGGALMNDHPSVDVVARIAESHRKYGTVGMMPTLVTDTPEKMRAAIAAVREARRRFPSVLGIHIEGPFLDPARKGAHDAGYIRPIEPSDIEMIASADCGAMMLTVAPNRVPPTRSGRSPRAACWCRSATPRPATRRRRPGSRPARARSPISSMR